MGELINSKIGGLIIAVTLALTIDAAVAEGIRTEITIVPGATRADQLAPATYGVRDLNSGECAITPNPAGPLLAPADLTVMMVVEENILVGAGTGQGFHVPKLRVKPVSIFCVDDALTYWSGIFFFETQDRVNNGKVTQNVTSGSLPPSSSRANAGRGFFAVSLASSSTNSDHALFVAAAKPVNKFSKLSWQTYRIQLTHLADGGHFCTPSAAASVLRPRVGVSAGRLFVSFDSVENFITTGSILDFDVKSLLRGGPVAVKCFTGQELKSLAPPNVRDDNKDAYFVGVSTLASVARFKLKTRADVANDTIVATPDINIPFFDFNPAAVQPNGFHLYSGGFEFQTPSVQIGSDLWNVHQIGDGGGHAKVRLYKFDTAATDPLMTLTLGTLPDQTDDLIAPSLEIDGTDAFVTFTRTIAANSNNGRATLMMARGPHSSSSGWTSSVLAKSPGQFSKNSVGQPCDPDMFAGCQYGPTSATVIDPVNNLVWGFGEVVTTGTLGIGGAGNEVNWEAKGVGVPR